MVRLARPTAPRLRSGEAGSRPAIFDDQLASPPPAPACTPAEPAPALGADRPPRPRATRAHRVRAASGGAKTEQNPARRVAWPGPDGDHVCAGRGAGGRTRIRTWVGASRRFYSVQSRHPASPPVSPRPARPGVGRRENGGKVSEICPPSGEIPHLYRGQRRLEFLVRSDHWLPESIALMHWSGPHSRWWPGVHDPNA